MQTLRECEREALRQSAIALIGMARSGQMNATDVAMLELLRQCCEQMLKQRKTTFH